MWVWTTHSQSRVAAAAGKGKTDIGLLFYERKIVIREGQDRANREDNTESVSKADGSKE